MPIYIYIYIYIEKALRLVPPIHPEHSTEAVVQALLLPIFTEAIIEEGAKGAAVVATKGAANDILRLIFGVRGAAMATFCEQRATPQISEFHQNLVHIWLVALCGDSPGISKKGRVGDCCGPSIKMGGVVDPLDKTLEFVGVEGGLQKEGVKVMHFIHPRGLPEALPRAPRDRAK